MNPVLNILYDRAGEKVAVQLMYDEYLRLFDLEKESPLLCVKVKQIAELLQFSLSNDNIPEAKEVLQTPTLEPEIERVYAKALVPALVHEQPASKPMSAPVPEPIAVCITKVEPLAPEIVLSENSPAEPIAKEYAIPIPPMLLDFLIEQDPSQKAKRLITACAQKLSGLCGKRITLSLHKPYICLWDFDEWKTFAFGEIIQGNLYLSVESSLQPQADVANLWVPPSGLFKKQLVRRRVDAITDELLGQLKSAIGHPAKPVTANI